MEQNQQEQKFQCTGDCLRCPRVQREYCGAQKGYDNQRLLLSVQETVNALVGKVEELEGKILAIQNNEALVFNPNEPIQEAEPIAQEGDGVEE